MQAVLMVMRLPLEPCRRLRLPCHGPNQFADKCGARHRHRLSLRHTTASRQAQSARGLLGLPIECAPMEMAPILRGP